MRKSLAAALIALMTSPAAVSAGSFAPRSFEAQADSIWKKVGKRRFPNNFGAAHKKAYRQEQRSPVVAHMVREVMPAVVTILVGNGKRGSSGTGFIVAADGLVITNAHVVQAGGEDGKIEVMFSDESKVPAEVLSVHVTRDMAFVKLDPSHRKSTMALWPVVTLAPDDTVTVGDIMIAIGSPFGLPGTVTVGHASFIGRSIGDAVRYIQTDASVNSGNSGGPLFNLNGEVVGVNTKIFSQTGENNGLAFSVPVAIVRLTIAQFNRIGDITAAFLGVGLGPAVMEPSPSGIKIKNVFPGSSAAAAGLMAEDVILAIDGKDLPRDSRKGIFELVERLALKAIGDEIVMTIERGGARARIRITLTKKPASMVQAETKAKEEEVPEGKPEPDREQNFEYSLRGFRRGNLA